jgi:hypothetical protein
MHLDIVALTVFGGRSTSNLHLSIDFGLFFLDDIVV